MMKPNFFLVYLVMLNLSHGNYISGDDNDADEDSTHYPLVQGLTEKY